MEAYIRNEEDTERYTKQNKKIKKEQDEFEAMRSNKLTVSAHWQVPPKTKNFSKATVVTKTSVKWRSDSNFDDFLEIVENMCKTNIKCGLFDKSNPPEIRMLGYSGYSSEYIVQNEMRELPDLIKSMSTAISIEVAIMNPQKHTSISASGNSNQIHQRVYDMTTNQNHGNNVGDDENFCEIMEVTEIKYDHNNITLRVAFTGGKWTDQNDIEQQVTLTVSTAVWSK